MSTSLDVARCPNGRRRGQWVRRMPLSALPDDPRGGAAAGPPAPEAADDPARLLALLQGIGDHVTVYDEAGRFLFINDAAAQLLAQPAEALLGRSLWEVAPETVGSGYGRDLREALSTGQVVRGEHHAAAAGRWLEYRIHPTTGGIVVLATDVTWRKHAEAAVAFDAQRFVETVEHLADTFTAVDGAWRITYMNRAALRAARLETTPVGADFWETFPFAAGSTFGDALCRVMATRTAELLEAPSARTGLWYENSIFPSADGIAMLSRDIQARKQAEAALLAADRRKDEFLATLGHELRNPLAPIRTAVQLLHRVGESNPIAVKARAIIDRQVEQLTRLVDDLLDVSRITRGQVELRRRLVDVHTVVEHGIESVTPLIDARQHLLTRPRQGPPLYVDGDPARLGQVVANLLHNAAKYTPEGGHLAVAIGVDAGQVVIDVRDNGRGLSPADIEVIFDLFGQVNRQTAHGGLGIGLTVARELVERHDGSLQVASDGPGLGATFTVRLPLASAPAAAHEEAAAPDLQPADGGTQRPASPLRRILVVDDNRDAADALAAALRGVGHEVRVAHDGGTALHLARAFDPDVAFLDIGLPGMSGYEVARALRQDDAFATLRLVAVTGWSQPDDRRKSYEAGFDAHLIKPADEDAIARLVAAGRR